MRRIETSPEISTGLQLREEEGGVIARVLIKVRMLGLHWRVTH